MREILAREKNKIITGLLLIICYISFIFMMKPDKQRSGQVFEGVPKVLLSNSNQVANQAGVQSFNSQGTDNQGQPNASVTGHELPIASSAQQTQLIPSAIVVDHSSDQNAFFQLDTIVQNDEQPENRLAAVYSLKSMLSNNDLDSRIRENVKESLRMATQDGDPRVVSVANEAYKQASK